MDELGNEYGSASWHPLAEELKRFDELDEGESLWWASLAKGRRSFPELETEFVARSFTSPERAWKTIVPSRYFLKKEEIRKTRTALFVARVRDGRESPREEEEEAPGAGAPASVILRLPQILQEF